MYSLSLYVFLSLFTIPILLLVSGYGKCAVPTFIPSDCMDD